MLRSLCCAVLIAILVPVAAYEHIDVREFVIRSQLAQAGPDADVFIGDSITEGALLPSEICGHRVVNAGVGGAKVTSYREVLAGIPAFKAHTITIALGTNDARPQESTEAFELSYSRLIEILRSYSDHIILVGIPPMEEGSISEMFDQGVAEKLNELIKQIADREKLQFIDLRAAMAGKDKTVDGVHLSPIGYRAWVSALTICH